MVDSQLLTFQAIKAVAYDFIEQTDSPVKFKMLLDSVGSDYDYIFAVLEHDILRGDFKASPSPRQSDPYVSILRDDTYLVMNYKQIFFDKETVEKYMVVRVLTMAGK